MTEPNNKNRIFDLKRAIVCMHDLDYTILVLKESLSLLFQKGLSELAWTYVEINQARHNRGYL